MSTFNFFVIFALFFVASSAQFTPTPGPEEPVDPIRPTIPVLYLSAAGPLPVTETRLTSFTTVKVCPANFPNGWTIRCDTVSQTSVIFRVKTKIYKKEFFPPYYIEGNWKEGESIPAYDMGSDVRQRIACRVRTRKPVWVDFVKEC